MNNVYSSTGAFTGRPNGRNHRLAIEYVDKLDCDGFEVLVFDDWYDRLETIVRDYYDSSLNTPIVHVDKSIGNHLSDKSTDKSYELMKINCDAASRMGAKRIVSHIWGMPHSDENAEIVYERVSDLIDISKSYGQELMIENSPSRYESPLHHLEKLKGIYPDIKFTIDTRFCELFKQLEEVCNSDIWTNVSHIHISDYHGGYMEWSNMYPILQPTHGDVDFNRFFSHLKSINYSGSLSLEAPILLQDRVEYKVLNRSLGYIKSMLK